MASAATQADQEDQQRKRRQAATMQQPAGLPPAAQNVLSRISYGEAPDYNVLYGGGRFSDYSDHPRQKIVIQSGPNAGKYTTAAGKYQFLSSTWDEEAKRLGLTDFSPHSQDVAAWDLANRTYKAQTGRDLATDAQNNAVNWSALGGQWESLQGAGRWGHGGTPSASLQGPNPPAGPLAGAAPNPPQQPWGDPDLARKLWQLQLLYSMFPRFQFKNVSYDPWAVAQQMETP